MQKYNFYELSGFRLIENLHQNNYAPIDFSTRTGKSISGVIKSVETHNDNAMFYQTKKCLQEMAGSEETKAFQNSILNWNDNSLKNFLIFIDFSKVFPYEKYAEKKYSWPEKTSDKDKTENAQDCAKLTAKFFENGFDILFEQESKAAHFVPFEKSASMARAASMIFIDSRLYEKMERRIRLGFNFSGDRVSASKLYAYTGLYLSDAKRIGETPEFALNEETVIVLADNVPKDKNNGKRKISVPIEVISCNEDDVIDQDGFQKWTVRKFAADEYKVSINYFDGEGLISQKYCSAINDILHREYGASGTAASMQIRMPFTKGMLHSVDFHKFICEELGVESCRGLRIVDAYNHERDLEKAQIILTQSMFKIDKWLTNPKISAIEENEDPMALYFKRFHKYDHAFHVGITDMNLSQSGKTKLNYQFLNTLALTDKELDEITDEQVSLVSSGKARELFRNIVSDNLNEDSDPSFDDVVKESETWSVVAARNPAFLNDPKVKGMLRGVRYSLLKDIGRGRLNVEGSTKFLSRDLLALLLFMIGKIKTCNIVSEDQKQQAHNTIRKEQLWTTKFFVADCVPQNPVFDNGNKKLKLCSKSYYGLLRSPHLSRNEQCSLSPFIPRKDGIYSRYFGHLKGIVMVPQFSFVPQALGGADFDGDMVKLITDKRINRAINEACYCPDTEGADKKHIRKLPIVMIPDTTPRTVLLPEHGADFQTLQDTFSSRVGELSNRVIYLGKREYDEQHPNPEYDLQSETGTILVGLEIDAAKTGRHPYLKEYLPDDRERDYFIDRKKEIDDLPEQYAFKVEEYPETQGTKGNKLYHRLVAVAQYGPNTGDALMTAAFTKDYSDFYCIDRLPQRFLRELSAFSGSDRTDEKDDRVRFAFEKDADWKEQASDPKTTECVKELIYSYRRILETARNVYRIEERLKKSNYGGCINTIFKIQYKGLLSDAQISDNQEKIFNQLCSQIDSYKAAEAALRKFVKGGKWQFCETDEEKNRYVESTLFKESEFKLSGEVQDALNNFRWNGYFLLYYYIKDIMLYYLEDETERRVNQGEDLSKLSHHPARFYEDFRQVYEQAMAEKESKKIWNRRIIEKCRSILKDEFSNQIEDALKYVHKLRSCDQYGTFFWDIFNADEILYKSEGLSHAE